MLVKKHIFLLRYTVYHIISYYGFLCRLSVVFTVSYTSNLFLSSSLFIMKLVLLGIEYKVGKQTNYVELGAIGKGIRLLFLLKLKVWIHHTQDNKTKF